jgi:hypothetical protein
MTFNPRGSIVCPSRPVEIEGGALVGGRKPGVIVFIPSTAKNRRELERFCARIGVDAQPVQYVRDELPNAYECVGSLEALERLTAHPVVEDWHLIVAVRVPTGAQGSGPEKVRPSLGSAFGKPAQVAATGAALAHDRYQNAIRARKAGDL